MRISRVVSCVALVLAISSSASAFQANYTESEPNDTKATANSTPCLNPLDTVTGNSTASSGAGVDYYKLNVCSAPLAIYDMRLTLTSAIVGHSSSLRGVGQVGAAQAAWEPGHVIGSPNATESSLQSHVIPSGTTDRVQRWYGFGKAESVYYRVTGAAATTANYVSTLTSSVVVPTDLGSFAQGNIKFTWIGQGHSSDSDMWFYDGNLDPIVGWGNDDNATAAISGCSEATGAGLMGCIVRNFAPGTYYMALSNFNLITNQPSPSDDDFRTGSLSEFAGVALNSSSTTAVNLAFAVVDSAGTTQVPATKTSANEILWSKFTVVPEPSTLGLLALGALALIRRRK